MPAKPSHFKKFPFNSVENNCESEVIALNIITILARTGDVWRKLTWSEYKQERLNDVKASLKKRPKESEEEFQNRQESIRFCSSEYSYFRRVLKYCTSDKQAMKFSKTWEEIGKKAS